MNKLAPSTRRSYSFELRAVGWLYSYSRARSRLAAISNCWRPAAATTATASARSLGKIFAVARFDATLKKCARNVVARAFGDSLRTRFARACVRVRQDTINNCSSRRAFRHSLRWRRIVLRTSFARRSSIGGACFWLMKRRKVRRAAGAAAAMTRSAAAVAQNNRAHARKQTRDCNRSGGSVGKQHRRAARENHTVSVGAF